MLVRHLFIAVATATAILGTSALKAQVPAPGNVTVSPMKGSVMVSWRGVRDPSVSYRVLRGPDPAKSQDLSKPLPADATSYDDGLPVMGTVFYTVVAVYRDGSQGASAPVQFDPAVTAASAPVAPMPTATVPSRLTTGMGPRMGPPTVLRATPVSSTWKDFWVTLTWAPVQTAAPEPVTYAVRRSPYDPAAIPPSYLPVLLAGTPLLKAGGMTLVDHFGDRENPVWYMVVATSTSQGSVNFPWYRQDPPPHRGVDTIIGHYWHSSMGTTPIWSGCVVGSPATDARAYVARVKAGSVGWVTIHTPAQINGQLAVPGMNVASFDTGRFPTMRAPLDGGSVPVIQMWPIVLVLSSAQGHIVTIPDTMHLQPLVYQFTQIATPLNISTCAP